MPVCGLEGEIPVLTRSPRARARRGDLLDAIVQEIRALCCCVPNDEGQGTPKGFMLGTNGGRIYNDLGGFVEHATPECRTPLEILAYQRANELLILKALARVLQRWRLKQAEVYLVRCTTDYHGHHYGLHLNYSTSNFAAAELIEHLTPFLVTRFYACAGGLGSEGFAMTHKNACVRTVASKDTRENVPIVNLKAESLAGDHSKRIHQAHNDACMSDWAMLLTVGCTALVVQMLDDGVCVGPAYKLLDPIRALRVLDRDVCWNRPLPLASGGTATGLQIQEHYLRTAEAYCRGRRPAWMRQVVGLWRQALELLKARGPSGPAHLLDAYIKRAFYAAYLRRQKLTLEQFGRWCGPVQIARPYLAAPAHRDVRGQLRDQMPSVRFDFLAERMRRCELDFSNLPRAAQLYDRMLVIDISFHDIDAQQGTYYRLRRAGAVDSRLISDRDVERATQQPPRGTRAQARAAAIRAVAKKKGAAANWMEVRCADRKARLPDPLQTSFTWKRRPKAQKGSK
jgi:hypothetical protein